MGTSHGIETGSYFIISMAMVENLLVLKELGELKRGQ